MEEWKINYLEGNSLNSIAKEYNVSRTQVQNYLLNNDVKLRKKFKLSNKQINSIIRMYTNGMNSNEIGKIIGVSGTTILRTLEKNGIKRRELSTALRTYPCNEHYFDVIDTEDKSYFFGLLFADGSLHNSLDTINISLQEGDKDILELMTTYIQPTKKLYYLDRSKDKDSINRKNQYKMEINSIHMGNLLNFLYEDIMMGMEE